MVLHHHWHGLTTGSGADKRPVLVMRNGIQGSAVYEVITIFKVYTPAWWIVHLNTSIREHTKSSYLGISAWYESIDARSSGTRHAHTMIWRIHTSKVGPVSHWNVQVTQTGITNIAGLMENLTTVHFNPRLTHPNTHRHVRVYTKLHVVFGEGRGDTPYWRAEGELKRFQILWDSNPRPHEYYFDVLTTELHSKKIWWIEPRHFKVDLYIFCIKFNHKFNHKRLRVCFGRRYVRVCVCIHVYVCLRCMRVCIWSSSEQYSNFLYIWNS